MYMRMPFGFICNITSMYGGDLLVARLGFPVVVHTRVRIIDRGIAATVSVGLDVLLNVDANGHRSHRDGSNRRDLAFRGVVVRVAEAPARVALQGFRLAKSNAHADGVERNSLKVNIN